MIFRYFYKSDFDAITYKTVFYQDFYLNENFIHIEYEYSKIL